MHKILLIFPASPILVRNAAGNEVISPSALLMSEYGPKLLGVAILTDGRIVVAGLASGSDFPGVSDFAVARDNGDGSLDTTFGNGGKVTTDFFSSHDVGMGLSVQTVS